MDDISLEFLIFGLNKHILNWNFSDELNICRMFTYSLSFGRVILIP